MPSSFTPLLKLELPATGELSGTWGTTVNNAITTPLSEAIAGTTTITVGGSDYTLSNGDGSAANEARKMFIVATGTPGASRNVICPAASKFYVFRNDTNQTLTLKTLSGTGIAVPAGQYRFLYCDGTNVVETFNAMASLTLGTALAAASGGTGQSSYTTGDLLYATGTTALSKLGIGAANRVLTSSGTAPQWVTSLTGLTGVSSSSMTNTSLTSGRLVYSTTGGAQTDSANLTFNGTTLVANDFTDSSLTATRVVYAGAGGNLVDSANLTFDGTSLTLGGNPTLSAGTANGVLYLNGSKVATSGTDLVFSAANGFITSGGGAFQGATAPSSGAGIELSYGALAGIGRILTYNRTGAARVPLVLDGSYVAGYVDGTEGMRLTSTGLGIGTTPISKLQSLTAVSALTSNAGFSSLPLTLSDSTALAADTGGGINFNAIISSGGSYNSIAAIKAGRTVATGADYRGYLAFYTGDNGVGYPLERMRLDTAGNLGIGTTSPVQKLVISNAGAAGLEIGPTIVNSAPALVSYNRSGGGWTQLSYVALAHVWQGSGSEQMRLDSSGNLGLGVTPSASWSSGCRVFQFGSFSAVNENFSGYPEISFNSTQTGSTSFVYRAGTNPATRFSQTNGAFEWFQAGAGTAGNAISFTQALTLDANRNLALNTTSVGTSAVGALSIGSGTEPSSGPADTVQLYSVDRSAGNTIPAFYCEGTGVTNAGITNTTVTHKIAMKINGTVYYLLATTNAT